MKNVCENPNLEAGDTLLFFRHIPLSLKPNGEKYRGGD